ncbi:MAG: dTDP-3-amino-3,4,6-trideoxy-alpha-D-glucose transaminase [Verrucomicrobiae bacterium]|nr:dTDP-3-amino-3,4,6-trideoxy-alpha-D-glucose transaminase [Verrucomicrobiae bacterium]
MSTDTPPPNLPYVDIARQHGPIKDELLAAVEQVLAHGNFILGPEVEEFEKQFCGLVKAPFSIGVNSGTDALILALRALGIGSGDEVITAANSFVASASCIAMVGARPVLVDVGEDYNIDPSATQKAITPLTKAILPVHLTGQPADLDRISSIASQYKLFIIEDAAQAVGATYHGKAVGSIGDVGCFSLHPLKTLNACGDGGMVVTHDSEVAQKIRLMRNLGLETRENARVWSSNSRLDTIQAAMLLVKLKYFESWTEQRRKHAEFYRQHLVNIPEIHLPIELPGTRCVYHTFVIQAEHRDELRRYLAKQGIGSQVHYPRPIHLQDTAVSLGYHPGDFPVTERQARHILSLPVYPELTEADLTRIVAAIHDFYGVA